MKTSCRFMCVQWLRNNRRSTVFVTTPSGGMKYNSQQPNPITQSQWSIMKTYLIVSRLAFSEKISRLTEGKFLS